MIDEMKFILEMQSGFRKAIEIIFTHQPHVEIYTISIWTDVEARRSAISFDTFKNSEMKRHAANAFRQQLRERFVSEGNSRRAALVPPEMIRNNNPADFEFKKVVTIENASLFNSSFLDDREW